MFDAGPPVSSSCSRNPLGAGCGAGTAPCPVVVAVLPFDTAPAGSGGVWHRAAPGKSPMKEYGGAGIRTCCTPSESRTYSKARRIDSVDPIEWPRAGTKQVQRFVRRWRPEFQSLLHAAQRSSRISGGCRRHSGYATCLMTTSIAVPLPNRTGWRATTARFVFAFTAQEVA
jgi:hypothetical protein